jgi:hypothetical protein
MQEETEIMISGVKLTDAESMTVRVAIDTLANVLAEGLKEQEGRALTPSIVGVLEQDSDPARESQTANSIRGTRNPRRDADKHPEVKRSAPRAYDRGSRSTAAAAAAASSSSV